MTKKKKSRVTKRPSAAPKRTIKAVFSGSSRPDTSSAKRESRSEFEKEQHARLARLAEATIAGLDSQAEADRRNAEWAENQPWYYHITNR